MQHYINLFGLGIRYWVCQIPLPLFKEMKEIQVRKNTDWESLLFDLDFLEHFGAKHWSAWSPKRDETGFFLHPENRIEIRQGGKLISRLRSIELSNQETLFPLYRANHQNFNLSREPDFQTVMIMQFEKGLIAKYKFDAQEFSIENLLFEITTLGNLVFLNRIEHKNRMIVSEKNDAVVTGNLVLIV